MGMGALMVAEGKAVEFISSTTLNNDTNTSIGIPLTVGSPFGGTLLLSLICPDGGTGNEGNSSYSYGWCYAIVYAGAWIGGTSYKTVVQRNYGASPSAYQTGNTSVFQPVATMNNRNILDAESFGVTRIDYTYNTLGNLTLQCKHPSCTANDTTGSNKGDLDAYPVYDQIFKYGGQVTTTYTPTWLYIYAPGNPTYGMTNFGTGSTIDHYRWVNA